MRALRLSVTALLLLSATSCCDSREPQDVAEVTVSNCRDEPADWADTGFLGSEQCPPDGWTGPVFTPLIDYPTELGGTTVPWKQYDFQSGQAEQYLRALLDYAVSDPDLPIDRIETSGWTPVTRSWFHAPWLNTGRFGREFAHGLTRERTSLPGELHPKQKDRFQNWAVSVFNARGGYALGRIWEDRHRPRLGVRFPEDTFVIKFLFTEAPVEQVPYLEGSPVWNAGIHVHWDRSYPPNLARAVRDVRLLQVDVAAKDSRSPVGWVFGSFVYHKDIDADDPWRRLLPVGLAWGNEFGPQDQEAPMWIAPRAVAWLISPLGEKDMRHDFGWRGRLNGLVDNPKSGCLSCHGTAQVPIVMGPSRDDDLNVKLIAAPDRSTDREIDQWFKDVASGATFIPDRTVASIPGLSPTLTEKDLCSTDYSLQVMFGIENFRAACRKAGKICGATFEEGRCRPTATPELNRRLFSVAVPGESTSDAIELMLQLEGRSLSPEERAKALREDDGPPPRG